jgi:4-aminobutyrate aminotransferase
MNGRDGGGAGGKSGGGFARHLAEGDVNTTPRRGEWQARALDPEGRRLVDEDAAVFLRQSLSTPVLAAVRRAEGIWLEDTAGRRYMDFHGNNVHHVGYGHPRLLAAVKRQMDELPFTPRRFTSPPAIALARRLAGLLPGERKVLFTTGGSDAIELALKYARAATGRFKTVSFWDSFHGAGFGASSVGGEALFRAGAVGPLLAGTEHVAPFACYRCPYGWPERDGKPDLALCRTACAAMVRYVLEKEGDVAAVVAEPIRTVPYIPPPDFWRIVRRACDELGAKLIFDEIPFGLGKTGRFFAHEHFGADPDIAVLGKALGGGLLPIAAMIARADLDVAADRAFGHYTHEKNPVTATAALTTLEIIESEGLVENAARVGARALGRMEEMKRRHRLIGDVRGLGLALGIELVTDRASKAPASDAAERVLYRALDRGLNFKTTMGATLTLTPPLTVTADEMDRALAILDACIGEEERAGG